MASKTKFSNILDTEYFGEIDQQFFLDIKKAKNNKHYLRITRRDQDKNNGFKRSQVVLFEDDFPFFVEALSMVLGRFSHGQIGAVS